MWVIPLLLLLLFSSLSLSLSRSSWILLQNDGDDDEEDCISLCFVDNVVELQHTGETRRMCLCFGIDTCVFVRSPIWHLIVVAVHRSCCAAPDTAHSKKKEKNQRKLQVASNRFSHSTNAVVDCCSLVDAWLYFLLQRKRKKNPTFLSTPSVFVENNSFCIRVSRSVYCSGRNGRESLIYLQFVDSKIYRLLICHCNRCNRDKDKEFLVSWSFVIITHHQHDFDRHPCRVLSQANVAFCLLWKPERLLSETQHQCRHPYYADAAEKNRFLKLGKCD